MQAVTTIGLDIAKSIFQVHGVDAEGNVVVRRKLKRRHIILFFRKLPPCLVGIEACASSWPGTSALSVCLSGSLLRPDVSLQFCALLVAEPHH